MKNAILFIFMSLKFIDGFEHLKLLDLDVRC